MQKYFLTKDDCLKTLSKIPNLTCYHLFRHALCLLMVASLLPVLSAKAAPQPVKEDLPMVGTAAHGHAFPGATVPFGKVQLSPDTRTNTWDGCSGYHYSDGVILGFSHTHLSGTGGSCLGDVMLMPTVGRLYLNPGRPGHGYASSFSHAQEYATPGYYRVFLQTPKVTAELTATARCGFHRYTFPASDQSHFILDLVHGIGNNPMDATLKVENDHTVRGSRISQGWGGRRAVYFVMDFSRQFMSFGIQRDGKRLPLGTVQAKGRDLKAFFNYHTTANEKILVKVGISGTSIAGARRNLAKEIGSWNFSAVRAAAVRQWKKVFGSVQVKTFDPHIRKTYYANLYLTCLAPTLFNDVDGTYRGYDHRNHTAPHFQNYTTFSIWDIYRAEWPLLTILHPARINDMVNSMLAEYPQLGQHTLPIWPLWANETWCMIGYHCVDMIADAYLEGFRGFNAATAYHDMRETAMQNRNGLKSYKKLGYVASRRGAQATSKTLEYAYDDWCIARMAQALGHTRDAELFYQRSSNYRHLFDRTTQFFRGRLADGAWREPFVADAMVNDEYTEADAWQYAFDVQQDVPGLIALYGGNQGFIHKMDVMFTTNSTIYTGIPDISGRIGQYSQGDEQSHHVAYLYDYAGAPYKTQQRVRQIMAALYNDTPAGQCGNVDCGQMAAWYVFSALGFYPVNPDSAVFAIGSPVVTKAVIHLSAGKYHGHTFTVIAKHNSAKNIYIQSATLNGKPLLKPWFTYQELVAGGMLRLVMGPKPNPNWGAAPADYPPATMPANFKCAPLPPPAPTNQMAQFKLPIRINCGSDKTVGGFVPDLEMLQGNINHVNSRIDTSVPHAAPTGVYRSERYGNAFTYTFPVPKGHKYVVRLHFAEIFDNGAGRRIENVYINHELVLSNFDIFVAADGMDKALVESFPNIRPNRKADITIRIAASPASPDQNAKISGIEILKEKSRAATNSSTCFIIPALGGKSFISINTTVVPDLTDWAGYKVAPVLAVSSVFYGMLHAVQQYGKLQKGRHVLGWDAEDRAYCIRWFTYEPQGHNVNIVSMLRHRKHFSSRHNENNSISEHFIKGILKNYDSNFLVQVNAMIREGDYSKHFWVQHGGKTVKKLGV